MIQRCLASFTSSRSGVSAASLENQYLVGSFSPFGHSINSHCSGWGSLLSKSRWAGRTRTAAKRERSFFLLPSRHVTVFHFRTTMILPVAWSKLADGFCSGANISLDVPSCLVLLAAVLFPVATPSWVLARQRYTAV